MPASSSPYLLPAFSSQPFGDYTALYIHTYIHTLHMPGCTRWLISLGADASGSGFIGFWFIFWLISIRALAMALLVSMLFSLNISAYLMGFSSLLIFVHSWMMCSWVSSASQQYLHLRVLWPFWGWFWPHLWSGLFFLLSFYFRVLL